MNLCARLVFRKKDDAHPSTLGIAGCTALVDSCRATAVDFARRLLSYAELLSGYKLVLGVLKF
jgi:hypothetical protein